MANRNGSHPLPSRPPLSSHQSNSVPSTPHQHARDFRSRSRSPSPHAGLGSHSPRSVKSEANGPMTTLPKGRPTCKYETSAAFSRRRMQYDIGDAPLDKPKEEPKKALNPNEEKKLSGDMRELYDRLLPSKESDKRRLLFVEKLEDILHKQWPDAEFKVHIFGSSGNLLCTSESDVDICIQTSMKKLETMHMLAEVLANNGMERVICIAAAKVPIVKIWDPALELAADMNVNNTLALENTRMIKTYVQVDERVRPLAMIVKHWTKQRVLNDAGIGGTLSSYAWICMILNFLQTRDPPILPALHQLPHEEYKAQDGTESGFSDDLQSLRGYGSANEETIGGLLFHFFRFYAHEFNYESSVISVRHGKLLTRKEKGWDMTSKEGQWRLCVEEPFNTSRNLGNSADSTAFRGIHIELRLAFDFLADGGQLDKCCEQYHFPPEEKVIFKKPVSGPKPVLSAIPTHPSRGGRGGANMRGIRHNNGQGARTGFRRSSSGASFGRQQYPPFLTSPPIGVMGSDYMTPVDAVRIQDQLFQQSQMYGMQIEQLKARMAYQQSQIQAAEQAKAAATAHAHAVVQGSGQTSQTPSATVSPQKTPYLTGSSSPQISSNSVPYPDYLYQPTLYDGQPMVHSLSQDGSRTNPPSPSTAAAVPSRRNPQRSSIASGSQNGSLRSQSQPARGMPQQFMLPGYPYGVPPYGMPQYPPSGPSQDSLPPQSGMEVPVGYDTLYKTSSLPANDGSPKEYVGYYMHPQAQVHAQQQQLPVFGSLPQIPQYSDLAHRRNRPSQDLQLTLNGIRRLSRSPSPLGHHRTFSTPLRGGNSSLRSAPLPKVSDQRFERLDSTPTTKEQHPLSGGLLIVNGSAPPPPSNEFRSHNFEDDLSTSTADDTAVSFPNRNEGFGHEDALGLSGHLPPQYSHEFMRQSYQQDLYRANASNQLPYQPLAGDTENLPPGYPSPPRAFPPFIDPTMPSARTQISEAEELILSPKSAQPSPWSVTTPPKPTVPPIDTSKAAQTAGKQSEPKTAPLLSPVYETRTPSPTAHRRSDLRQSSINGILPFMNGDLQKENTVQNGKPISNRSEMLPSHVLGKSNSIQVGPGEKQGKAATSSNPANAWQTTTKKKNRKRTKSGPNLRTGNSARGFGEPLPTSEAERKGG